MPTESLLVEKQPIAPKRKSKSRYVTKRYS